MADELKPNANGRYPFHRRLFKILLWTILAVVLLFYGTITCLVTVLSPDRLTPLVTIAANRSLNADVKIGRVEFSAMSTYPFLRLEIDSLTVVSRMMAAVRCDSTTNKPLYADTLLSLKRFVGELELLRLAMGTLCISDVELVEPSVNLVSLNDSISNFDIFPASTDTTSTHSGPLPDIVLRRFAIVKPGYMRYFDAESGDNIDIKLEVLLSKEGNYPRYRLDFGGNMATPLLETMNMTDADFALNGDVEWDLAHPCAIALRNFRLAAAFIATRFNLAADFTETLRIDEFDIETDTISVSRLLACLPDSLVREYSLNTLRTDALVSVKARLDSVFDLETDSIPYATCSILIPECGLRYGRARFDRLSADMGVCLRGNDPDDAEVNLRCLDVSGPATSLHIAAGATRLLSDPLVDLSVRGKSDLSKLPPPLMRHVNGFISGAIDLDVNVAGKASMLAPARFHNLSVKGDIDGKRLYWVSGDTANMAYIHNACLKFGSEERYGKAKNLLAAVVKVDSVDVLTGGIGITVTDFALGFGVDKNKLTSDTTIVVPMGGGMKIGKFNLNAISDSIGVRIRNIDGKVVMRRFNDMKRVPQFIFDLGIDRMAAGSSDVRMLFSNSKLNFTAHKLPSRRRASPRMKQLADSIKASRPDLPMDSVYKLAIERGIRNRKPYHRVHAVMTDTASEVIDWGTSKFVDKLLLDWTINGSLTSRKARLFTPHFPLRNRLNNLNITFNNDTILLKNLAYKVGRSDFMAVGRISNLKRALTSARRNQALKLDFETESDTIDVNQIAGAFFRGAAASEHKHELDLGIVDSDIDFEAGLDGKDVAVNDTVRPMLLPVNVEADMRIKARNVLYSDLLLHNLTGNVFVYDGALNLHHLQAASDVGGVDLSALYSAPDTDNIRFGFGLNVNRFDIARFIELVPALDSIMPLLRDISGIIDADIAATVKLDKHMDFELPTLAAAIKLQGDSLQLLDRDTFRTIAKWLLFKDKQRNVIDHMTVEFVVSDNQMYLYPFVFDIDRYRLGIQGHNDLALNFDYMVSVLKSPLPFKFGITIKGTPEDYKIRLGRAKFNEKQAVERKLVVDTTRINLLDQIESVFRRGVSKSEFAKLNVSRTNTAAEINLNDDPVTAADSLVFIREGLIPAPETAAPEVEPKAKVKGKSKKRK